MYVRIVRIKNSVSQPRLRGTLGLRITSLVILREMFEYVYTNFGITRNFQMSLEISREIFVR